MIQLGIPILLRRRVALFAAVAAVGLTACSSDGPTQSSSADAASAPSTGEAGEAGLDSGALQPEGASDISATPDGDGGSSACVDASLLENVDAMSPDPAASCVRVQCLPQLTACNNDCACRNDVISVVACTRAGGTDAECLFAASMKPTANATLGMLFSCYSQCLPALDAGADGEAPDSTPEAAPSDGPESAGHVVDGGAD